MKTKSDAFGAKLGDSILDTKRNKVGVVEKEGQSGNYSIIYVNFGRGLRRINPLDDAQVEGRYKLIEK